jgi:hypothetical protein
MHDAGCGGCAVFENSAGSGDLAGPPVPVGSIGGTAPQSPRHEAAPTQQKKTMDGFFA